MAFRVLALAALAALAWYAIYRYHQRRGEALEQAHARHHGWKQVTLSVRQDVWKCPRCRALIETWPDVVEHQGTESPCGVLEAKQAQLAELERAKLAGKDAESAGRWSVSATVGGEEHRGAVDMFAGELGSGCDDGS